MSALATQTVPGGLTGTQAASVAGVCQRPNCSRRPSHWQLGRCLAEGELPEGVVLSPCIPSRLRLAVSCFPQAVGVRLQSHAARDQGVHPSAFPCSGMADSKHLNLARFLCH